MKNENLKFCIDTCIIAAEECDRCFYEFLKEPEAVKETYISCIQIARNCAEICSTVATILNKGSRHLSEVCKVCIDFCNRCAEECEKHSDREECRRCAQACRKCASECMTIAKSSRLVKYFRILYLSQYKELFASHINADFIDS